MQNETKAQLELLTSPHPVAVLRFEGDIASTSKDVLLSTYQSIPPDSHSKVVLDFTQVDYINSSGIALVIQLLIEATNAGQMLSICGLSPHFAKVFTMVGIPKYAALFPTRAEALAAL